MSKTDCYKSTLIDKTSVANTIFIGKPATDKLSASTAAAIWKIKKITDTGISYGGGSRQYNQIWDNRTSLTYS